MAGQSGEELALIAQCQAGDAAALDTLLRRVRPLLLRYAGRLCRVRSDVDDVVQLSLLEVSRSIGSFRREARLSTWMYTIVNRVAARHNRPEPVVESLDARVEITPERTTLARQRLDRVAAVLEGLSHEQRQAWVLFELEDQSLEEIAAICEVPRPTAATRLREARLHILKLVHREQAELSRLGVEERA